MSTETPLRQLSEQIWRRRFGDCTIELSWDEWLEMSQEMGRAVLAEAERAHRWIPVSERIPEFQTSVMALVNGTALVVAERADGEDGWLWAINHFYWNLGDGDGMEIDDDYNVTHWKPLDEPPTEAADLLAGMRR